VLKKLALFVVLACSLIGVIYSMETKLGHYKFAENQVWKHRQNIPEHAIMAVRSGFGGYELDIMFHENDLYVSHDPGELAQAVPLREHYIRVRETGADPYIWLDLKNISIFNEARIIAILKDIGIGDKLLVESPFPYAMTRLCRSGFSCSIWAKNADKPLYSLWYGFWANIISRTGNLAAVSIHRTKVDYSMRVVSNDIPLLLYTFPPNSDLSGFLGKAQYKILLTD